MTSSAITVTIPTIIVAVNTVTSRIMKRRALGLTGSVSTQITFTLAEDPPRRLDKAIARDVPETAGLSRSRLARLIAQGAVRVGADTLTDPKAPAQAGMTICVTLPDATRLDIAAEPIPLDIVHEDAELLVVNKAAGMVVHPAPGSTRSTLVNALLAHCAGSLSGIGGVRRPGIVHRIDKDTSGLLVVAKSDRAHHGLAEQFARHSVDRCYTALCCAVPNPGDPRLAGLRGVAFEPASTIVIRTQLARHKTDRQRQAVLFDGGRHAVTRLRVDEVFGTSAARISCWLETGRTHQIRVHAAYIGHRLIGDPVYGGRQRIAASQLTETARAAIDAFPRQALHAETLGFTHPLSGERLRFHAPAPSDFAGLLTSLRAAV